MRDTRSATGKPDAKQGKVPAEKTVAVNRRATYEYTILETYEAGIALTGTEIKSIRAGQVSLQHAYVAPREGSLWVYDMHIAPYQAASRWNHEPTRPRQLLLHRREINHLIGAVSAPGHTIVPLRLYLKNGIAKLEIALVRGKRSYDQREAIARREAQRAIERALRRPWERSR